MVCTCRKTAMLFHVLLLFLAGSTLVIGYDHNDEGGLYDGEKALERQTRTMSLDSRWTKYRVPYELTSMLSEYNIGEIYRGMHTYERITCMRFVEWKNVSGITTNMKLDLGYEGHLRFENGEGCYAPLGNQRKIGIVHCCSGSTCVHELGHALGMTHEAPSPSRDGWIRVDYQNIANKYPYEQWKPEEVLDYGYDYSSVMHYATWAFRKSGAGPTFTFLFKGLHTHRNWYYVAREVSLSHKCEDIPECSSQKRNCDNDGYFTLVDGQCSCRCIQGLDPETGCTTVLKNDPSTVAFPEGQYAFPKPAAGCPTGFVSGSRTHYGGGGNSQTQASLLAGEVSGDKADQQFCVKSTSSGSTQWPAGNYCIYRKDGKCPAGFTSGSVTYDDVGSSTKPNSVSGELPDGSFAEDSTTFQFCCRSDGFSREEIFLPSREAFTLFKYPDWDCQRVRNMHSTVIQTTIYSDGNGMAVSGKTPVSSQDVNAKKIVLDTCYYQPADIDCGGIYELSSSNPTVMVTSKKAPNQECVYFFKAPKGSALLLNTPSINIDCSAGDKLEIRNARPQQPGEEVFCGTQRDETTRSILNYIFLRFSTFGNTDSQFTAVVSLLSNDNTCYKLDDRGMSYDGQVNYTRHFEPCLRWDEVTHCPHNAFNQKDQGVRLVENYCRNPSQKDGFQPWCYTVAKGCVRDYCDACLLENHYDINTNCQFLSQAGACQKSNLAMKSCAKTCEESIPWAPKPPVVSSVTCGPPDDVPDAILMTLPQKTGYEVGEVLTYNCLTHNNSSAKRRCLSSGQWTTLKYACGECPSGWEKHSGKCYAFFPELVLYDTAKQTCESNGGILATAKNAEEVNILRKVAFASNFALVFIGLSDAVEEGKWVWSDGEALSDWNNWEYGDPNNYGNQDCGALNKAGEWSDVYCEDVDYKRPFVCQAPINDVQVCDDNIDTCENLFSSRPDMCTAFPDFASQYCRYTCGLCLQDMTDPCSVPQPAPSSNKELVDNTVSFIKRGQAVKYRCKTGTTKTGGQEYKGCTLDGTLAGDDLICLSPANMKYIEVKPGPLRDLGSVGYWGYSYTGTGTNFQINRPGEVTTWKYYSRNSDKVVFQVWRPRPDLGQWKFELVGMNPAQLIAKFEWSLDVPPAERIQVQTGDIIGLYFDYHDVGGVTFSTCDSDAGNTGVMWSEDQVYDPSTYAVGQVISFSSSVSCRYFSFHAVVGPSSSTPPNSITEVIAGPLKDLGSVGYWGYSYTGTGTSFQITRPGEVTTWKYYSQNSDKVVFQVWRPRPDLGQWKFELIGMNPAQLVANSEESLDVSPAERIQVQTGDIIGLYFDYYNRGGVTYSFCDSDSESPGNTGVMWSEDQVYDPSTYAVGQVINFSSSVSCRFFSFHAVVGPSSSSQ